MRLPPDMSVDALVTELHEHPVNENVFFRAFRDRPLPRGRLLAFLGQYHYFCKHFVKLLEGLLFHTPVDQLEMRVELAKTLYSELGSGRPERAHLALLERFAAAAGLSAEDLGRVTPAPPARTYLDVLQRLFTGADYLRALGAELAVEATAASEFRYLYPALQRNPEFSEASLEFFRLHLAEEQCHSDWLVEAVRRTARTPEDLGRVAAGARETADAWHAFWLGLHAELFATPVSVG